MTAPAPAFITALCLGALSPLAACTPPAPTSAPEPLANQQPRSTSDQPARASASAPDGPIHGRFIGRAIGYEISHFGRPVAGTIQLPAGMERRANINFADSHRVVTAVADDALVIFLTDEDGVVLDDVTLPGLVDAVLVADCDAPKPGDAHTSDAPVLGVVRMSACPDANTSTAPVHAYGFATGQLTPVDTPVTCDCFMVRDDEPIP